MREIVESVVVAFVLAFLFRTFEAEAFVIPTGSMAPTLMGRHKDVTCPKCGYPYRVSASAEMDHQGREANVEIISGTCPMCHFTMDLSHENSPGEEYPSYKGDRIIVGKFNYHLGEPKRWDVAVFRFPGKAATNYIKRIAGLPKETLRIWHGDIWTKPDGAADFTIARKSPEKILATMQPVYDADYVLPQVLLENGYTRWHARPSPKGGDPWRVSADLKSFSTDGAAPDEVWMEYQHVVPSYHDWLRMLNIELDLMFPHAEWDALGPINPQPQLINDFTAYNTEGQLFPGAEAMRPLPEGLGYRSSDSVSGLNWVGDLVLEFEMNSVNGNGEILVDLIQGGHEFLCRLDLAKGAATLEIPGVAGFHASSPSGIRGPGRHRVRFANVDNQLVLWLDGSVVQFDRPTSYDASVVDTSRPTEEDLRPVRIGSRGAAVEVRHLRIFRDLYYIATRNPRDNTDFESGFNPYPDRSAISDQTVSRFLSDPGQWDAFAHRRAEEFPLQKDQFFMLGDNSASSSDGRLWEAPERYVDRDLLIGKALFIYWPHGLDRIPGTKIHFPFGLFPNFARMRFVR